MPVMAQSKWRWCSKCQGLWYSAATQNHVGVCPSGPGGHTLQGSGDYALFEERLPLSFHPTLMAQQTWRWCSQCGSLWHPTSALPTGVCPAPGSSGHSEAGSGDYALLNDSSGNMG